MDDGRATGRYTLSGRLAQVTALPAQNGVLVKIVDIPASNNTIVPTAIPENGITPYMPEQSCSVGAQCDHKLTQRKLSFRVDGSYQGELYTTAEDTSCGFRRKPVSLNLRAGWKQPALFMISARIRVGQEGAREAAALPQRIGMAGTHLFEREAAQRDELHAAGQRVARAADQLGRHAAQNQETRRQWLAVGEHPQAREQLR